jgi:radical SAM superfamily enzyme
MKSKHPQKQCIVCGTFIYIDELEKHYLESLNHRNCARCNIGFETDQLYDEVLRLLCFLLLLIYLTDYALLAI